MMLLTAAGVVAAVRRLKARTSRDQA